MCAATHLVGELGEKTGHGLGNRHVRHVPDMFLIQFSRLCAHRTLLIRNNNLPAHKQRLPKRRLQPVAGGAHVLGHSWQSHDSSLGGEKSRLCGDWCCSGRAPGCAGRNSEEGAQFHAGYAESSEPVRCQFVVPCGVFFDRMGSVISKRTPIQDWGLQIT